jgi:hypothetical protein
LTYSSFPHDSGLEIGTNEQEIERLEGAMDTMSIERTIVIIRELAIIHHDDPNFSGEMLQTMYTFLADPSIAENPDKHPDIVQAMKIEAILATENSPYVEVRANVDPTDDPTLPVSTVRAWFIGVVFSIVGSFIDNLFAFRNPGISVGTNVAQLLACKSCFIPAPAWSSVDFRPRSPWQVHG